MSTGVIQRLVKDRGFGFIKSAGGHELFFHRSQVQGATFELLTQGQSTIFKVELGRKGLQAIDVRLIRDISNKKTSDRNFSVKEAGAHSTKVRNPAVKAR